jgi:biotin carboxyl carrier protein
MKGKDLINEIVREKMPDIEQVREKCHNTPERLRKASLVPLYAGMAIAVAVMAALGSMFWRGDDYIGCENPPASATDEPAVGCTTLPPLNTFWDNRSLETPWEIKNTEGSSFRATIISEITEKSADIDYFHFPNIELPRHFLHSVIIMDWGFEYRYAPIGKLDGYGFCESTWFRILITHENVNVELRAPTNASYSFLITPDFMNEIKDSLELVIVAQHDMYLNESEVKEGFGELTAKLEPIIIRENISFKFAIEIEDFIGWHFSTTGLNEFAIRLENGDTIPLFGNGDLSSIGGWSCNIAPDSSYECGECGSCARAEHVLMTFCHRLSLLDSTFSLDKIVAIIINGAEIEVGDKVVLNVHREKNSLIQSVQPELFSYPTLPQFTVSNPFRPGHRAIDIMGDNIKGTPVFAAGCGVVTEAEHLRTGYGHYVIIQHGEEYGYLKTLYSHLDEILVEVGQKVTAGEQLATVGNTGRSEEPHLHFEVIDGSRRLNPKDFLPAH